MPIIDNRNTDTTTEGFAFARKIFQGQVDYDYVPNGIVSQMLVPGIGTAALQLMGAIMHEKSRVPAELKMLIAYMTSYAAGCTYCQTATYQAVRELSSSGEKFASIWEYRTSPLFTDAERAALELALAASSAPSGVTDVMRENLKEHFNQEECAEIIAMIALFAYFQTWNDTNGTNIDDTVTGLIEEELAGSGYLDEEKFARLRSG